MGKYYINMNYNRSIIEFIKPITEGFFKARAIDHSNMFYGETYDYFDYNIWTPLTPLAAALYGINYEKINNN